MPILLCILIYCLTLGYTEKVHSMLVCAVFCDGAEDSCVVLSCVQCVSHSLPLESMALQLLKRSCAVSSLLERSRVPSYCESCVCASWARWSFAPPPSPLPVVVARLVGLCMSICLSGFLFVDTWFCVFCFFVFYASLWFRVFGWVWCGCWTFVSVGSRRLYLHPPPAGRRNQLILSTLHCLVWPTCPLLSVAWWVNKFFG